MLLEAHSYLEDNRPLAFVPVSIAHEHIPEEKSHAKELRGAKKEKENAGQLFNVFKIFTKKLGTIHARFSNPIIVEGYDDLKVTTQKIAFDCFRSVGKAMPVTPSSLLALTMLDEPAGVLTWKQIEQRCLDVIEFCQKFNIPFTESLDPKNATDSIKMALDIFISSGKIEVINKEKLNQIFYTLKAESRIQMLFHKNMILHHFLVPAIMNATWFNIFNGNIKSSHDLTKFLLAKRKELKYEFYLPSVKEMIGFAIEIVSWATGKKMKSIDEALKFTPQQLHDVAMKVRRFSTAFSYIYEAYFLAVISVKYLLNEPFGEERFIQVAKELAKIELEHGRIMKYSESFSVPAMKDTLKFLENQRVIERNGEGDFVVVNAEKVDDLIEKFAQDINDQVSINLKFNKS